MEALFGNLYVDHDRRARARDEMFSALRRGDEPAFEALAEEYSVTYVLWVAADGPGFDHLPFREPRARVRQQPDPNLPSHGSSRDAGKASSPTASGSPRG